MDSVFVLVDVQERLYPHMHQAEELGRSLSILLRGFALLGVPGIVTQQYTKGLGSTIGPLRAVLDQAGHDPKEVVEKLAFGCCDEPSFVERLDAVGKHVVVLAGIEAHVCVLQTAIGLAERGFRPVVVADCVSSRRQSDRDIALRRMEGEGVLLTSYESLLFELTRVAGTDTFRAVSRLVK
jgi:nicotinamidase-related amidase